MKSYLPNFITLLNLLCGCVGSIMAIEGDLTLAAFFVLLGIFFDFFDGFLARKLGVEGPLGIQLDSMADLITSGLVPGLILFQLLRLSGPDWPGEMSGLSVEYLLPFAGILVTLAAAYRLARFNLSDEQTEHFIGLPTPANALLVISLPLILEYQNNDLINATILSRWFLLLIIILGSVLMNANIKLLALKFKNWGFADNAMRYILIIGAAVLLLIFKFAAIPLIILLYLLLSLLNK